MTDHHQDDQVHWQRNLLRNHNKSKITVDYQPTTVKLHPLKKTTAMNIKLNIGKNKRDSEKIESNGRDERENDSVEKI